MGSLVIDSKSHAFYVIVLVRWLGTRPCFLIGKTLTASTPSHGCLGLQGYEVVLLYFYLNLPTPIYLAPSHSSLFWFKTEHSLYLYVRSDAEFSEQGAQTSHRHSPQSLLKHRLVRMCEFLCLHCANSTLTGQIQLVTNQYNALIVVIRYWLLVKEAASS